MWVMYELKLKYMVWLVSILQCKENTLRFPMIERLQSDNVLNVSAAVCNSMRYDTPFIFLWKARLLYTSNESQKTFAKLWARRPYKLNVKWNAWRYWQA